MFPFWRGVGARLKARLERVSGRLAFRIAVAALLAGLHLVAFWYAGHDRLGVAFDAQPDHEPMFSDVRAPVLVPPPRQPHYWPRLIVSRFDAQHYIAMAARGLSGCPTDGETATDMEYLQCGLGWLPAWGVVGGSVARTTGLPVDWALVLLSILCAIVVNTLWTSKPIVERIGRLEAYGALLAFNCYPPAFHMVTPYTEAATLALTLGGYILITYDRWWLASLCVGATTALRPHAVAYTFAFGLAALAGAWQKRKQGAPRWWMPLLSCVLAGWGQLATMLALKVYVGDAWAFFRARHAFGDQHSFERLYDGASYIASFGGQNMDGAMWFALVGIVLLVYRDVLVKMAAAELAFLVGGGAITAAFAMVAPLLSWGTARYMMLFLVGFLCAGKLMRKYPLVFLLWIVFCLAIYWELELCNYISQGDPRICDCQGRLETFLRY